MKKSRKFVPFLTAVFLMLNQLGITPQVWGGPPLGVKIPTAGFQLNLPPDLGTIQNLISGSGPTVIHIQTAHGNYEAQKKIQSILHYLKDTYGFKLLLLEGTSFKLEPELLHFFPKDNDLTMKVADELTKKALLKGSELFLLEDKAAQAYGIENLESYVANGEAVKAVLTQKEKSENFLRDMDLQIERLTSPYLNKDLRAFLKRVEDYELKNLPFIDWLLYLKNKAKESLELDLTDPANQIDWPMLLRIYKLREFESKIDLNAFAKEKAEFLKKIGRISKETFQEVEKLLSSPLSQNQLPDPETGLLFERMVSYLPPNFDYKAYPNVNCFMGHLILQSELKGERLFEEMTHLTDKISEKLAKTSEEKKILTLLKDHRLLKKLFALELAPTDYEAILNRGENLRSGKMAERFLEFNEVKRVRGIQFKHLKEIDSLFEHALEFYRGVKERDGGMLQNIEARLKEAGADKAIVITGGFHAEPFKEFFQSKGYNYARVAPKITSTEGKEAYVEASLQNSPTQFVWATRESPFPYALPLNKAGQEKVNAAWALDQLIRFELRAVDETGKIAEIDELANGSPASRNFGLTYHSPAKGPQGKEGVIITTNREKIFIPFGKRRVIRTVIEEERPTLDLSKGMAKRVSTSSVRSELRVEGEIAQSQPEDYLRSYPRMRQFFLPPRAQDLVFMSEYRNLVNQLLARIDKGQRERILKSYALIEGSHRDQKALSDEEIALLLPLLYDHLQRGISEEQALTVSLARMHEMLGEYKDTPLIRRAGLEFEIWRELFSPVPNNEEIEKRYRGFQFLYLLGYWPDIYDDDIRPPDWGVTRFLPHLEPYLQYFEIRTRPLRSSKGLAYLLERPAGTYPFLSELAFYKTQLNLEIQPILGQYYHDRDKYWIVLEARENISFPDLFLYSDDKRWEEMMRGAGDLGYIYGTSWFWTPVDIRTEPYRLEFRTLGTSPQDHSIAFEEIQSAQVLGSLLLTHEEEIAKGQEGEASQLWTEYQTKLLEHKTTQQISDLNEVSSKSMGYVDGAEHIFYEFYNYGDIVHAHPNKWGTRELRRASNLGKAVSQLIDDTIQKTVAITTPPTGPLTEADIQRMRDKKTQYGRRERMKGALESEIRHIIADLERRIPPPAYPILDRQHWTARPSGYPWGTDAEIETILSLAQELHERAVGEWIEKGIDFSSLTPLEQYKAYLFIFSRAEVRAESEKAAEEFVPLPGEKIRAYARRILNRQELVIWDSGSGPEDQKGKPFADAVVMNAPNIRNFFFLDEAVKLLNASTAVLLLRFSPEARLDQKIVELRIQETLDRNNKRMLFKMINVAPDKIPTGFPATEAVRGAELFVIHFFPRPGGERGWEALLAKDPADWNYGDLFQLLEDYPDRLVISEMPIPMPVASDETRKAYSIHIPGSEVSFAIRSASHTHAGGSALVFRRRAEGGQDKKEKNFNIDGNSAKAAERVLQYLSLAVQTRRSEVRSLGVAEAGTVKLGFKNALAEKVTPEHGVTTEELKSLVPRLEEIHGSLKDTRAADSSDFASVMNLQLPTMKALSLKWRADTDDVIVIGGGLSGAEMAFRALVPEKWNEFPREEREGFPRIRFVEPDQMNSYLRTLNPARTRVLVMTSDLTQDPFLESAYEEAKKALGSERLRRIGELFSLPSRVNLQDAFFSAAGLLPLVLAGRSSEAKALVEGALGANAKIEGLAGEPSTPDSPGILNHSEYVHPALTALLHQNRRKDIGIFHVFSEKLRYFGTWRANRLNDLMGRLRQSLVFRGAVGTRHNHAELQNWQKGDNRFQITTVGLEEFSNPLPAGPTSWPLFAGLPLGELMNASREGTEEGLGQGKRPNMSVLLPKLDANYLGRLMYSALYEDRVLEKLLKKTGEESVETQHVVKELREVQAKEALPSRSAQIQDPSGIGFDYIFPSGNFGPSESQRQEIEEDLVKIMQEVARERLSDKHDYLSLPRRMIERVQSKKFREAMARLKKDKTKFIIIGIGGSSQGAKMELENLGLPTENLIFLEGIDPDYTEGLLKDVDLTKAGVLAISKSGETLESNVLLSVVRQRMEQALHAKGTPWDWKDHIVAVTDPVLGILRKEAGRYGYGLLEVPPLVDGRFSVLSDVGISVLSLVMPEAELLEFLGGAEDYVLQTELNLEFYLEKVKRLENLDKKKEKSAADEEAIAQLKSEVDEESQQRIRISIGYQYGGWSAFFTIAKQRGLWLDIALSSALGEMAEEMTQLWNESLGKPAVDEKGRGILFYRRGIVAPKELIPNLSNLLTHPSQVVTLWDLRRTDDPVQDRLQKATASVLRHQLREQDTPVFEFDIPRTPRALGALTVMKQQAVMVQSKTRRLGKVMDYSGQPGVELAKRYARKRIQAQKGVSIDVIPHELAPVGDLVRSVGLLASRAIANVHFVTPKAREEALARLIRQAVPQHAGNALIKTVWMRGEAKPRLINKKGTRSLVVVPLDESRVIDMNNGSVGSLFSLYEGNTYTPDKLLATFVVQYGPTTTMIARIKSGEEPQVYDFIWNEETHEFVQKQHAGRETSLIEMSYKGDEIAIYGKVKDWPKFLEEFYYAEIMRSGKKVRISESVADLYEMILKGGIIAVPLTEMEAVMWASIMEGAGGRSLVMTEAGPQSASLLSIGPESFEPGKRRWAFFGNKEVMDRLEGFMKKAYEALQRGQVSREEFIREQLPVFTPLPWRKRELEQKDEDPLKETLEEMGEEPEAIQILLNAARTVTRNIRPMFSMMGIEEGGGQVNLAGDEQVGADIFTNVSFRNSLLNPQEDPALETELVQAELSGKRVPQERLRGALISAFFSEEEDQGYPANPKAKYFTIFDPLDGSSKVDTNGGVSSIGGIWKSARSSEEPAAEVIKEGVDPTFAALLKGRIPTQALYGAFFFLYGPQTLLYYTSEKTDKVYIFRLNHENGTFIRMGVLNGLPQGPPKRGLRLAIGGERPDMVPRGPRGLHPLLTQFEKEHAGRAVYSGSLNVDFVGVLNGNDPNADGGVYAYPGTERRPDGRLRLDSELSPLSYIIEKVGGRASNGRQRILDIPVGKLHQHEPFFIGTKWVIDQIEALHRSEVRSQDAYGIAVPDIETRGQAVIDFLMTYLGKRREEPLTYKDLEAVSTKYYSERNFEREGSAFTRHILGLVLKGGLDIPHAEGMKPFEYQIHAIGSQGVLDLDVRFEEDSQKGIRLTQAMINRGNTGAVAAQLLSTYGKRVRFLSLIGATSAEGKLLPKLGQVLNPTLGEAIFIEGDSRTSIFLTGPPGKETIALKPNPAALDEAAANRLLEAVKQKFPRTREGDLVILEGQIFVNAPLLIRLIPILETRGYRTFFDAKPYQSFSEIGAVLGASPFAIKFNLEEFAELLGRRTNKEELKKNPRFAAQRAAEFAFTHRIPLFMVSMEEKGAIVVYREGKGKDAKWKAIHQPAPQVEAITRIAAGDAFIAAAVLVLSQHPQQLLTEAVVQKLITYAVAAGAVAVTKPATEVGSKEDVELLVQRMKPPQPIYVESAIRPEQMSKRPFYETAQVQDVILGLQGKDLGAWPPSYRRDIVKWLGWFDAPVHYADPQVLDAIEALRKEIEAEGVKHIVLIGTGGSVLGADTLYKILPRRPGSPDLTILDLTHPRALLRIQKAIKSEADKTLFIVSSKSGTTMDTVLPYRYFRNWLSMKLGLSEKELSRYFIAITDPDKTIDTKDEAVFHARFRKIFRNNPEIGGRFSVISYFGLVPAALTGVDIQQFLASTRAERQNLLQIASGAQEPDENRVFALFPLLTKEFVRGKDKFTFVIPREWAALGPWLQQLLNESLGKKQQVPITITEEAEIASDRYDKDRLLIEIIPGAAGKLSVKTSRGLRRILIPISNTGEVGALMFDWMVLTALLGHFLRIHPFDQPGVELSKVLTKQALTGQLPVEEPKFQSQDGKIKIYFDETAQELFTTNGIDLTDSSLTPEKIIGNFLGVTPAKSYVAVLSYDDEDVGSAIQEIRGKIQKQLKVATLGGIGPRYEHSDNQLLSEVKGHIVLITFEPPREDLQIPGEQFSFYSLTRAKAMGNLATYRNLGRSVLHLHLSKKYRENTDLLLHLFSQIPSRAEVRKARPDVSQSLDAIVRSEVRTLFNGPRDQILPLRLEEYGTDFLVEVLSRFLNKPVYTAKAGISPSGGNFGILTLRGKMITAAIMGERARFEVRKAA